MLAKTKVKKHLEVEADAIRNEPSFGAGTGRTQSASDIEQSVDTLLAPAGPVPAHFEHVRDGSYASWPEGWLVQWSVHNPPTLGLLLAGKWQEAADFIKAGFDNYASPVRFPGDRVDRIVSGAWADLEHDPSYDATRQASSNLVASVREMESALRDGLRRIQDLYEGGVPPV